MPADEPISIEMLIWAYSRGIFPMADHRHGKVEWFSADPRAVLPLEGFKASHSLRKRVRDGCYDVRIDAAFESVIRHCSQPRPGHPETWINETIVDVFVRAHEAGLAHSVEAWTRPGDGEEARLVGGLYGLALGGAFFGESMFSRATDASKVCLVHLVERLRGRGFVLLDVQMNSRHMSQFGTIDIPRREYLRQLEQALVVEASWD